MKYLTQDPKWIAFYPKFSSSLYLEKAGYFDERPQLTTSITQLIMLLTLPFLIQCSVFFLLAVPLVFFGWGVLYVNFPIKTGIQDCDSAAWGFNYHNNKIWIYVGGTGNYEGGRKWKTITMPWEYTWVRTSLLLKNQKSWIHETRGNSIEFYEDVWKDKNLVYIETYPYTDKYDGEVVSATIQVKEREWRMRFLKWTKRFAKVIREINIEFSSEVGREKGSYKGGCIGCSYELLPNETPLECLKRMEQNRSF